MKLKLPHTLSIIFSLIIIMAVLTWVLPAGQFDRIHNEAIGRDVVVPGTYKEVPSNPQGFLDTFSSFARGIVNAAEVIAYVLIIGGAYGVILKTGAINNGLKAAVKKLEGREFLLIPVLMFLFSIGGTMAGMYEETLAFYLILIPLMVRAGYDPIVGVATILLGVGAGLTASIGNPFATGIASHIAEIPITDGILSRVIFYFICLGTSIAYVLWYANRIKKNPKKSICYANRAEHQESFANLTNEEGHIRFGLNQKLIIIIFLGLIFFMMYAVVQLGWWIPEMTVLFLAGAMVAAILGGLNEKEFWDSFVEGSKDLLYAAIVVGLTRAIVIVAQDGAIIDTILHGIVSVLSGLSQNLFIMLNQIFQLFIAFLVPSSSGHAALTMPLMAPLADLFSVPRSSVVTAYQTASGLINQFAPTAAVVMAAIGMAKISYFHWLKFVMPLLFVQLIIALVVLVFTL
ncbi:MAG: YfcC family protein [Alphaproteobacteria bacterium]|nr:YfcC family protein [Alphaproteobacteria bacterium]